MAFFVLHSDGHSAFQSGNAVFKHVLDEVGQTFLQEMENYLKPYRE